MSTNAAPQHSNQPSNKHRIYLGILSTYVAIIGTIFGILFAWSQLRIAKSAELRARRTEPISYTLETVNTHYQYDIQSSDISLSLPAPSLRLRVTHGSLHSIAVLSFDGTEFYELSVLPISDSWGDVTTDITTPAYSVLTDGNFVYDYFFLYLEPAEGENQLDLICNTISLSDGSVRTDIMHPISLAQIGYLPDGPREEMLSVYHTLWEKLSMLGLLT